MASRAHVNHKINARQGEVWYPWLRTDPNREIKGYIVCTEKCQRYVPQVVTVCPWGSCTEIWCGVCRRFLVGYGPVGCGCDWYGNVSGGRGHHTREEQARPRTRKYKRSVQR